MSRTVSLLALALVLAITASCSDDPAPTDNRARVDFETDSLMTAVSVYVTLKDGEKIWDFKPEDFRQSDTDTTLYRGPEVQTADAGSLLMEFQLFTPGGTPISSGSMKVPLSPNWRWSFSIFHAVVDFPVGCADCYGSSTFEIEIPGHEDERIYVVTHGKGS